MITLTYAIVFFPIVVVNWLMQHKAVLTHAMLKKKCSVRHVQRIRIFISITYALPLLLYYTILYYTILYYTILYYTTTTTTTTTTILLLLYYYYYY